MPSEEWRAHGICRVQPPRDLGSNRPEFWDLDSESTEVPPDGSWIPDLYLPTDEDEARLRAWIEENT
jgi:hypothetical protein